jgi:hypothetical protein
MTLARCLYGIIIFVQVFTPSPGISSVPVPVCVCAAFSIFTQCLGINPAYCFAFIDVPVVVTYGVAHSSKFAPCYGGKKGSDLKDRPITWWDPP